MLVSGVQGRAGKDAARKVGGAVRAGVRAQALAGRTSTAADGRYLAHSAQGSSWQKIKVTISDDAVGELVSCQVSHRLNRPLGLRLPGTCLSPGKSDIAASLPNACRLVRPDAERSPQLAESTPVTVLDKTRELSMSSVQGREKTALVRPESTDESWRAPFRSQIRTRSRMGY
ncbi:hypothetical protein V2G26_001374 [Clonostachys chloroleuca]